MKAIVAVLFCVVAVASAASINNGRLRQDIDDLPDDLPEVDVADLTFDPCADNPCGEHGTCVTLTDDGDDSTDDDGSEDGIEDADVDVDAAIDAVTGDDDDESDDDGDTPDFVCICHAGYTGDACDQLDKSSPCAVNPCKNGGSCVAISPLVVDADDVDINTDDVDVDSSEVDAAVSEAGIDTSELDDAVNDIDVGSDDVDVGGDDSDDSDDDDIDYVCVCPAGFFGNQCEDELDESALDVSEADIEAELSDDS